ncbi:DUF3307 domain-containing protein [Dactylosporangium aurantiacum]|uniref:DUF3307 domain-containing protein n=1 Tax=Dactylosporangium aurantiacum TaxID=35754 RepID=UPI0005251836|nr:DUF3307 domain-containing protein [Dactylosporangium aurantiacum]MDG6101608.1 DUF3307 domain-containing protein [Dactylosporangium aurantiacum]
MSYDTLTRSVVFVVTLTVLLVGHSLGDHVAQTDRQASHKAGPGGAGWRALAGHLLTYHLTITAALLLTCAALRLPLSPAGVAAGVAFSAVTHGLLDRRWPVRAVLRATGSPQFADTTSPVCGMYVADQALHQASLLVAALLVAGL